MPNEMDWSKANKEYEVYPSGTYRVQAEKWERCEASTGTPQVRIYTTIREPVEYEGKPLTGHFPLTSKSQWKLATAVQGFGVDLSDVTKMVIDSAEFNNILDTIKDRFSYWRIIKDEEYNNNKVEEFHSDANQDVVKPEVAVDESCPFE